MEKTTALKQHLEHRLLFIGGLHRSGTTALNALLGTDARVSVFSNTGVTEDEGQYLQTVLPLEREFGAVGEFALDPRAHITEESDLLQPAKERLFAEWSRHWDLTKKVLVEKTPSNIIRMRFLRAVFPNANFIVMIRHPVAITLAATKWKNLQIEIMLENWVTAHEIMSKDLAHIGGDCCTIIRYEDFISDPKSVEHELENALGFAPELDYSLLKPGLNKSYFERWRNGDYHLWGNNHPVKNRLKSKFNRIKFRRLERELEKKINRFGYSFRDVYEGT